MSAIIEARRIMLARRGRTMTLRRVAATSPAVSYASVTGTGYSRVLPADPPAGVAQGRLGQLAIEIGVPDADPDGYGSPRSGDEVLDNGASYGVIDARPLYDGPDRAGWTLLVRGDNA